jgi:hypothetical protein
MKDPSARVRGNAALIVAIMALVVATTGVATAKRSSSPSTKPKPLGLLLLNKKKQFPASVIPKVRRAKDADAVGGRSADDLALGCNEISADIGTWCLMSAPYGVTPEETGKNNYFFATQKCAELGGYLPTAAQLIGAAPLVKLSSTIGDNATTANIDEDPTDGTKDRREMSATLVTTAAGARAAGSEGVSDGSRGDPRQGEPDPPPVPANPAPDTLQYVTVYDNGDKGGFAGSRPVSEPENFRCAFDKQQGVAPGAEPAG